MFMYHLCVWCLWRPKEDTRSPGTEITDSCKLPCGCWDSNLGPSVRTESALAACTISPALIFFLHPHKTLMIKMMTVEAVADCSTGIEVIAVHVFLQQCKSKWRRKKTTRKKAQVRKGGLLGKSFRPVVGHAPAILSPEPLHKTTRVCGRAFCQSH